MLLFCLHGFKSYYTSVNVVIIHRQKESFQELWNGLDDSIHELRLVAVSSSLFLDYISNIIYSITLRKFLFFCVSFVCVIAG